jgi:hypothetical protein
MIFTHFEALKTHVYVGLIRSVYSTYTIFRIIYNLTLEHEKKKYDQLPKQPYNSSDLGSQVACTSP